MGTKFNPNEHMGKFQGKDYLEVKWRIVWFREQHPEGTIDTQLLHHDPEKGLAVFKAVVQSENGRGTGHGSGSRATLPKFLQDDYLEKAETAAIGRALAMLGYGTQFASELEEGEKIVDSPVQRRGNVVY